MKKYAVYITMLAIGLLVGWFIFGKSSEAASTHNHTDTSKKNQMWTCSMHPQIMQPEPGDCPICGMDLIPAEAGADGLAADQFKLSENAMALANIQTSIVGNDKTEETAINLSGKIAENEESNAVQVGYFSGRIEKLNVSFTGEKIYKGQLLATIYSPGLYAAQQELITAASLKKSQPTLYKAVRNKLKLWKLSDNQINKIESSGKVLENFPVYATVSGTVSEKLVEQGDYIKQGQPLLKIAKLNTVWANFDVYENQLNLFKKGQKAVITTNAYPNKTFKGKVSFIDPVLDTQTRTVKLRVVLNNTNNVFKPGMFVEGKIEDISSTKKQLLSIPSSAVLWTGKRSVVYIKANPNEPVFEMREVNLGNNIGKNYEVLSGLKNGDEIVTYGTFTLDAAAQLQGKKSMMNKGGGKVTTGHEEHLGMETANTSHSTMNKRIKVSKKFQKQLQNVVEDYILLKNALANDNATETQNTALSVASKLEKIEMTLLTDKKAHNDWMKIEKEIKTTANSIASKTTLKEQRDHFKHLSSHLTTAIELFGINKKLYRQFCPMADNNKGAYWLSKEEKVLNPYFGQAMHSCGEVRHIIE